MALNLALNAFSPCTVEDFLQLMPNISSIEELIVSTETKEEAEKMRQEYEILTNTKFVVRRTIGTFCSGGKSIINAKVRWKYDAFGFEIKDDGIPFVIVGKKMLECQNGIDHDFQRKSNRRQEKSDTPQKKRKLTRDSKKLNCTAQIKMIEVMRFPHIAVSCEERGFVAKRATAACSINAHRTSLSEAAVKLIYISFPAASGHWFHDVGINAEILQPIDKRIVKRIYELIEDDPKLSAKDVKGHLEKYVQEIQRNDNSRFHPTHKDVENHIYLARKKQKLSTVDYDYVTELGLKQLETQQQIAAYQIEHDKTEVSTMTEN
uniref:Uncharacterized protein n=1 Tax=Strigamia maritima TaxID=126957 RepID=T1J4G8_STRMM